MVISRVSREGADQAGSEEVVKKFFKLIDSKSDVDDLLDLFEYDAVVKEPFSKPLPFSISSSGLKGRSEIGPFLKVALMVTGDMRRRVRFEERQAGGGNGKDRNVVCALVTFEKGDRMHGRFVFELAPESKKIRRLVISLGEPQRRQN
jgi:hypothetical protein